MKQFTEILKVALGALYANKLKSSLTILGIVVGIFSIISISTVIEMMQTTMQKSISGFGQNSFYIQKFPAVFTGGRDEWRKYRNRKDITYDDYLKFEEIFTEAESISGSQGQFGVIIKYGNYETNPDVYLQGVTLNDLKNTNYIVEYGRAFNSNDIDSYARVVIIGVEIQNKLFKNMDPLGQTIKIDGNKFQVIGILEKKGEMFGQSQDNNVFIPLTAFHTLYGKKNDSMGINVRVENIEDMDDMVEKAKGHFRKIRKVPPGEENDFEVFSNDAIMEQVNNITSGFRIGSIVIAGIALLAAGVGIMNIMLVSVTERTREIGIRKSIGAKKSNILLQFIIEAIVLCQLGGLIGIALGVAAGNIVGSLIEASFFIPIESIIVGVLLCTIVGVVFGTYPAYKASNLDPIEALRYE